LAFVALFEGGLYVVDVSDPSSLAILGVYLTPDHSFSTCAVGDYAFLGTTAGLTTLDVSDPANPAPIAWTETPSTVLGVSVSEGLLYAASYTGTSVFDISDPTSPLELGLFESPAPIRSFLPVGPLGFAACTDAGLYTFDISAPKPSPWIATVDLPDVAGGMELVGDLLFVAVRSSNGGVQILDVSDPAAPSLVASVAARYPYEVAVEGSTLYVTTGLDGMLVFDVSTPSSPTFLAEFQYGGGFYGDIEVRGSIAYLLERNEGVQIADVSDPMAIELLGTYQSANGLEDIAVEGSILYGVDDRRYFQMIDVSAPSMPMLRGVYEAPEYISEYLVDEGRAYIAYGSLHEMSIVDVADPGNPVEIGSVDASISSVAIDEGILYAADSSTTFAFDVGIPAVPRLVGIDSGRRNVVEMIATESNVFVAEEGGSAPRVAIIDATDCWDCPADVNGDGVLDTRDVIVFLNAWSQQDSMSDCTADGAIDTQDVLCYLNMWTAGC
jgi:hypothetical protein